MIGQMRSLCHGVKSRAIVWGLLISLAGLLAPRVGHGEANPGLMRSGTHVSQSATVDYEAFTVPTGFTLVLTDVLAEISVGLLNSDHVAHLNLNRDNPSNMVRYWELQFRPQRGLLSNWPVKESASSGFRVGEITGSWCWTFMIRAA